MIDIGRASLPEISAAISIFPQTFTQTLSESLRESRPIVSEFVVHRFPQPTGLRLNLKLYFEQVWFPGVHADIGGGYLENEARLSDNRSSHDLVATIHDRMPRAHGAGSGRDDDRRRGPPAFRL
jgi:Uncharacterized alpha/beta hydrolase domain (DUF2235)